MSEPRFLLDTGPLTALFDPRDQYHPWAAQTLGSLPSPLTTCEPVLTEAFYLLSRTDNGVDLLGKFCESGAIEVHFDLMTHVTKLRWLIHKYSNIPMALADGCLVVLSEQHPHARVVTTDRDFQIYRTSQRRQIKLIAPFAGDN